LFNLLSLQAARLKLAMYPMAGALVGGCVGGPVGLVAGMKIGAAAALTGGIAGEFCLYSSDALISIIHYS
jgi:syntaxin 17